MNCSDSLTLKIFYPRYSELFSGLLCDISTLTIFALSYLQPLELLIYAILMLLSLIHVIILLQKPIRSSSVGIFLIFIAFSVIGSVLYTTKTIVDFRLELKTSSPTLGYIQAELILPMIQKFSSRSATWLTIGMGVGQFLASRNDQNLEYSSAVFGIKVIFLILIPNMLLSVFGFFGTEIVSIKNPFAFITNSSETIWSIQATHLFSKNDNSIQKMYTQIENIMNYWLPTLLTIILFFALNARYRAGEKRRKREDSISHAATVIENNTKLVYNLTKTYFIVEFEISIINFIRSVSVNPSSFGTFLLLNNLLLFFNIIQACVMISNIFLCVLISSQYRLSVRRLLCCGNQNSVG